MRTLQFVAEQAGILYFRKEGDEGRDAEEVVTRTAGAVLATEAQQGPSEESDYCRGGLMDRKCTMRPGS